MLKSNVNKNQCGHWHDTKRWALSKTPLPGFPCWCIKQPGLNRVRRRFLFERGITGQRTMSNTWWDDGKWWTFPKILTQDAEEKKKSQDEFVSFPISWGRHFSSSHKHPIATIKKKKKSVLKYLANKRTWKTFLLPFHYFGVIGEPLKTRRRSELIDEDGNKYSQAAHTLYYPDKTPRSSKSSGVRENGIPTQSSLPIL